METEKLTHAYLETLSFSDLCKIADEYGLDVPESLNRRFLIGEILELGEYSSKTASESMVIASEENKHSEKELPKNYNETQISCVLRNPVWAFVFWNISESDNAKIKELPNCNLMIRVCILSSEDELKPEQAFEVNVSTESQEQYILLPSGQKYFRFELVYVSNNSGHVLAFSPVVHIPQPAKIVNEFQPGKENDFSEVIKLSGINKVLMDQYKNHRQSFS